MKKILWVFVWFAAAAWFSPAWAKTVVPFSGTLDFRHECIDLLFDQEDGQRLSLNVSRSSPSRYLMSMDVAHIRTPLCDVAARVQGHFELEGASRRQMSFSGEISSHYTLLDYKPIRDLYLKFSVRDRKLVVDSFWAGALSGRGEIDLTGKKLMNISLELLSADLEDILPFVRKKLGEKPFALTGVVTGGVSLSGPWSRPEIRGRLVSYNGRLKSLDYDSIVLDFEGAYPVLRLRDAVVTQTEGLSFKLAGAIDLSRIEQIGTQLRMLQKMPVFSDNNNRREWVLRRLRSPGEATIETSYFLMQDERNKSSAVVGVRKSIEF